MRISDWSSDVCSSDLRAAQQRRQQRAQFLEDVVDGLDQLRALPNQGMTTACLRIVDRARDREHLAALFQRVARGDQRAGTMCGLDHQGSKRSEEHTSELPSLMRTSYAVFCLKTHKQHHNTTPRT